MSIDQKEFYEIALNEIETKDDSFSRGIWALALVQCDGNEEKAKIKYISLRVEELIEESSLVSDINSDSNEFVITKDDASKNETLDLELELANKISRENDGTDVSESANVSRQDRIEALENMGFQIEKLYPERYVFQKNYARLIYPDKSKVSFKSKTEFDHELKRLYVKCILQKNIVTTHDEVLLSPSKTGNQNNFLSKIYHGEYSLPVTYWVFGVVVGALFKILDEIIFTNTSNAVVALIFLVINITYTFIICVGIWRAADNYNGEHYWATLAKFAVIFSAGAIIITYIGIFAGSV